MTIRPSLFLITCRVALTLIMTAASGIAYADVSGLFVERSPLQVAMVRIVEAPPGHLSGSLVISELNKNGIRKKDVTYGLSGSINGSNVSLKLSGGMFALAQAMGTEYRYVGSLQSGTLTLSYGKNSIVLQKTTQANYLAALAELDTTGEHMRLVSSANEAIQTAKHDAENLNASLTGYMAWGAIRIKRIVNVKRFYEVRLIGYRKCLDTIKPLAASHVPSWRWQKCVLDMSADSYSLSSELENILALQSKNKNSIDTLNAGIDMALRNYPEAIAKLRSSCQYRKDPVACNSRVTQLKATSPYGYLDRHLVTKYRNNITRIRSAITTDVQTARQNDKTLSDINHHAQHIYNSAS